MLPLIAGVLGGALVASTVALVIAIALNWTPLPAALRSGSLGFASLAVAAVPAAGLLRAAVRGGSRNFGMFVAAAGGLRMFLSLGIALVIFFAIRPEARTFWSSFVAASLAGLVVETWWAMNIAGRITSPSRSAAAGPALSGAVS